MLHSKSLHDRSATAYCRPFARSEVKRLSRILVLVLAFGVITGCNDVDEVAPKLSGCPTMEVAVGTSFVLTITVETGELFGIRTSNAAAVGVVEETRTGPRSFTVTVTPDMPGDLEIIILADATIQAPVPATLSCNFKAIPDKGACCQTGGCQEFSKSDCEAANAEFQGFGSTCDMVDCFGACCGDKGCTDGFTESGCMAAGAEFQGLGSTCDMVSCLGACCGDSGCEDLLTATECAASGGKFRGGDTTCGTGGCSCTNDSDCRGNGDPCTVFNCLVGTCGEVSKCFGLNGGGCNVATGVCPIQIDVAFPTTLSAGESADVSFFWSGENLHFRKTVIFGSAVGRCPEGFSCRSSTLSVEFDNPVVIPNAFSCPVSITEPVSFLYDAALKDGDELGSDVIKISFMCVP